jgi:hypothetical protein
MQTHSFKRYIPFYVDSITWDLLFNATAAFVVLS